MRYEKCPGTAPSGDPIPLPRGRELVTLEDAGNYITKLPKAEHETPEWQVGDVDHLKVFANDEAAEKWFKENDPEGVAFEYEVLVVS